MYKYEIHLHDNNCSACGRSAAREMVDAAKEHGYAGIIFTNHFFRGNTCIDRALSWPEFVREYEKDYLDAKEYACDKDIDVIFGIEELYRTGREVLIYGLDASVIAAEERFPTMSREEISDFVRSNGGFIAVAHPFRHRGYIPDPDVVEPIECFDAVEVYNAANPDEDNAKALDYCKKYGSIPISGGDVHKASDFGQAGLAFEERITDNRVLVQKLRNSRFSLIIKGEIVSIEDYLA